MKKNKRGKKFDAAEKHFEKKSKEWKNQIKTLEQLNKEKHFEIIALEEQNEKLIAENERLIKQNQVLMELHDLSAEDVRALVKYVRTTGTLENQIARMMETMSYMF